VTALILQGHICILTNQTESLSGLGRIRSLADQQISIAMDQNIYVYPPVLTVDNKIYQCTPRLIASYLVSAFMAVMRGKTRLLWLVDFEVQA
jgi:hypothetical protein